jgi:hypothetical protein
MYGIASAVTPNDRGGSRRPLPGVWLIVVRRDTCVSVVAVVLPLLVRTKRIASALIASALIAVAAVAWSGCGGEQREGYGFEATIECLQYFGVPAAHASTASASEQVG